MTLDGHGNVYFTERGSTAARVRKISAFDGKITTVAGTGWAGYGAGGRPALETSLDEPCDVAVDRRGSVYIVSGSIILEVPARVRLAGQLVVTASSVSGDPVTHSRIRFLLDGNVSACFPGNATSAEVMTNEHGIATAPVLMVGANVGMFTVHVIDLDNPKSHPTTTHPETTSR